MNYRWSANGLSGNEGEWTLVKAYSAKEMLQQVKEFDGRENTDATPLKVRHPMMNMCLKVLLFSARALWGIHKVE